MKSYLFAVITASVLIMSVSGAWAVEGQQYFSDGALPNATVPPGGWTLTDVRSGECLGCHNQSKLFGALDISSYLMHGHRNMLRQTQVNIRRTGPDGKPYLTDSSGYSILWDMAGPFTPSAPTSAVPQTLDRGSCSVSGYFTRTSCEAAGGSWAQALRPLFYIYNGWMWSSAAVTSSEVIDPLSSITSPGSMYGGRCSLGPAYATPSACTSAGGTWSNGGSYSCGRCHTTGFTMDAAVQASRPPELTYPGITRTGTAQGHVSFDPDGNGPAVSSSWAKSIVSSKTLEGVQCERCHRGDQHLLASGPPSPRGTNATMLCLNCHRQEHTVSYDGVSGLGSNIRPTPFTDNFGPQGGPASEPIYPLPKIEVGGHGGYAPEFYGHSTGMEFLNSVHGQFAGNFQEIADPARYDSFFVKEGTFPICQTSTGRPLPQYTDRFSCEAAGYTWAPGQGNGCTTCHNIHQSSQELVAAPEPFVKECRDCHLQGSLMSLANIKHPTGPGTPLGDLSDIQKACATCHMPRPAEGEGLAAHLWRINVSASYRTFPTQDEWNAGQKTAFTAPMDEYLQAVWVDIDLACGQCHGGGTDSISSPATRAVYMSKTTLANLAKNMHSSIPAPAFTWSNDSTVSLKVNFDAKSTTCPEGATCNYVWDFGDGSCSADPMPAECRGVTTAHTYADAGPKTVTLTVDTYGSFYTKAKTSMEVVPVIRYSSPSASASMSASGMTVTITDISTDSIDPQDKLSVSITWGDGTSETKSAGQVFTKTYTSAGTYTISHRVVNTAGMSSSADLSPHDPLTLSAKVTVPVKYSISGRVTRQDGVTPIANAAVYLRQGGSTKYITSTKSDGTYTVTGVAAGTYDIVPSKAGYTFIPVSLTVDSDKTGIDFRSSQ